ncbi:MAG TPA: YqgE/AlgH family protein [Tepidisphaeraceae bacterium]|jgi:putative transcriptional regulator|nr:YqgE/AlgH family protein [Tepidisphaeraceae bacterium]
MNSYQGHLLIASPKLLDPNFHRAVVLIVQHNDDGALGLILNRPLETTIDMIWDQVSDTPCFASDPLHHGGPCEGALMVLHGDMSLSQAPIVPGVFFSADKDSVEQLIGGDEDGRPVRFYVGYAGWSQGQLEAELEAEDWLTLPAAAEHVFDAGEDMWDNLHRRIVLKAAYPWLNPNLIPDDPSVN